MNNVFDYMLLTAFGWLLGLLTLPVAEVIKKQYHKKEIIKGILLEIKEINLRNILVTFLIASHRGTVDKKLLILINKAVNEYRADCFPESLVKILEQMLSAPEEQVNIALTSVKKENSVLSIKKYHTPFLDSKFEYLSMFSNEAQLLIFETKAKISLHNEEIENANYFFKTMLNPALNDDLSKTLDNNLNESYKKIEELGRYIAGNLYAIESCLK
ncbi:MAG: hypothetical protein V1933_03590 [Candidatus Omnitrophota bacterium]